MIRDSSPNRRNAWLRRGRSPSHAVRQSLEDGSPTSVIRPVRDYFMIDRHSPA